MIPANIESCRAEMGLNFFDPFLEEFSALFLSFVKGTFLNADMLCLLLPAGCSLASVFDMADVKSEAPAEYRRIWWIVFCLLSFD